MRWPPTSRPTAAGPTPAPRPSGCVRGPLEDDQRARLAEIAEKTPVTRAVRAGTEIRTTVERA